MTFRTEPPAVVVAAVARPGDTVIIAFHGNLTDQDIDALTESFRPIVESGIEVAFTDQVASIAVARPGDVDLREMQAVQDDDIDDWGGE